MSTKSTEDDENTNEASDEKKEEGETEKRQQQQKEEAKVTEEEERMQLEGKQEEGARAETTMSLDVAYKSLEMIRRVNLQVEFGREIQDHECVMSLRQARDAPSLPNESRFRQFWKEKTTSKASPCLTCGTPVSKPFRSPEFARQNITVCVDCSNLFSLKYLMNNIVHGDDNSSDESRKQKLNHMLEVRRPYSILLDFLRKPTTPLLSAAASSNHRCMIGPC